MLPNHGLRGSSSSASWGRQPRRACLVESFRQKLRCQSRHPNARRSISILFGTATSGSSLPSISRPIQPV